MRLGESLYRRPLRISAIAVFFSYLILFFTIPELFSKYEMSFLRGADHQIAFRNPFILLSNFYHGGIQLWDSYDQMPMLFAHVATGLYSISNLIVAFTFFILSPFIGYPGKAYQLIFSVFYFLSNAFILTFGLTVLLRRFTSNAFLLILTLVYANTVLSAMTFAGLPSTPTHNFFPLLIHLILAFFERFRFKDFLMALLLMGALAAGQPFITFHHFYQCVHFTVIAIVLWSAMRHRAGLSQFLQNPAKGFSLGNGRRNRSKATQLFLVLTAIALMLAPVAWLYRQTAPDLDFDQAHSRFKNPLSARAYFEQGKNIYKDDCNPISEIGVASVNFVDNAWYFSWSFTGVTLVFWSLIGLIVSRDSRKYIFLSAAVLICLVNGPREGGGFLVSGVHWLNALTNPFKFMLRSFSVGSAYLLPLTLLPVALLGMQALGGLARKEKISLPDRRNMLLALILIGGFIFGVFNFVPFAVQIYLLATSALMLVLFAMLLKLKNPRRLLGVYAAVLVMTLMDAFLMGRSYAAAAHIYDRVIPHRIEGLDLTDPVILDYQNPRILPVRRYFSLLPSFGPASGDTLIPEPQNQSGVFLRHTNLRKYFEPANGWYPAPKSFSKFFANPKLANYLSNDERLIFQAGSVDQPPTMWRECRWRLEGGRRQREKYIPRPTNLKFSPTAVFRRVYPLVNEPGSDIALSFFPLPKDFPAYLATSIFTLDRNLLKARIGDTPLRPAQGWLNYPFTFDVQNMSTGKLIVALPPEFDVTGKELILECPEEIIEGVSKVWKNEPDNFGFDYHTDTDGWLVFRWPYDKKWKLWIDDKPQGTFKANECFMTFPLTKGKHKILLRYWPDTPLRWMIGLSIVLYLCSIGFILWKASKDCKDYPDSFDS